MKQRLIDANKLKVDYIVGSTSTNTECYRYISKNQVDDAPTVEAIPYEFLRELAKNQSHYILTVWDFLPKVIENIIEVWEDWEKESER